MTENKITLESMVQMPIGDVAKLTSEELSRLMLESNHFLANAKRIRQWVESAVALKYREHIIAKRRSMDKDTGVIHIDDNGYRLTTDVTKKVEWDQDKLEKIVTNIKQQGDNPLEYVDVTYKVSEKKYSAWPASIRKVFESARTLKTGNPSYLLTPIDKEAA